MPKDKAYSFHFNVNDWLSSTSISLMTPAEEGAYIRLLCHAWASADCSLPVDDKALASLSRLGIKQWLRSSKKLRKNFVEVDGKLFNERQLVERMKLDEWKRKSVEGGRVSGKKRLEKTKGGSEMVRVWLEANRNQAPTNDEPNDDIPNPITETPNGVAGESASVDPKKQPIEMPRRATGEISPADWPETTDLIFGLFPNTAPSTVMAIVIEGIKADPKITDRQLFEALGKCVREDQYSAGLFKATLPSFLRNAKARDAPKAEREIFTPPPIKQRQFTAEEIAELEQPLHPSH